MGVSEISYLARHDEDEGAFFQLPKAPTSILLFSSSPMPDTDGQGSIAYPVVWAVSDNEMLLGGGWEQFEFEVPSSSNQLPEGWHAYPDTGENLVARHF